MLLELCLSFLELLAEVLVLFDGLFSSLFSIDQILLLQCKLLFEVLRVTLV